MNCIIKFVKKYLLMKNLNKILILFLALLLNSCGESEMVSLIKNGTLENYPEKNLGIAIDNYFGTPYWTSGESEDGEKFVNIEGRILFMDKEVDALLQYTISADNTSFEYSALELNGVPQSNLIYLGLIESMYK